MRIGKLCLSLAVIIFFIKDTTTRLCKKNGIIIEIEVVSDILNYAALNIT